MDLSQVGKAIRAVDDKIVTVRTGTVVTDMSALNETKVILDNDPTRTPVTAQGLTERFSAGARVKMLAYPPRGLVIIGTTDTPPIPPSTDTGWIALTLEGGWSNFGAGFANASYRVKDGVAYIKGLITGGGATPLNITTIPLGARVPERRMFSGIAQTRTSNTGAASAGTAHTHPVVLSVAMAVRIDFLTSGVVQLADVAATGYLSLDGISYPVT